MNIILIRRVRLTASLDFRSALQNKPCLQFRRLESWLLPLALLIIIVYYLFISSLSHTEWPPHQPRKEELVSAAPCGDSNRRLECAGGLVGWSWTTVSSFGHQHPCHSLHSCPSDHNTYVCGDKERCDQYPDNEFCLGRQARLVPHPPPAPQSQMVEVKRVLDGDTLELSMGEKVRLIGVDTPETKDPRKPVQY